MCDNREGLACTYACLLLHDDGIPVTPDKISALLKAANVKVQSYWPKLFSDYVNKRGIDQLIVNFSADATSGAAAAPVAAVPAAATAATSPAKAKNEEAKVESDEEDFNFSLFD